MYVCMYLYNLILTTRIQKCTYVYNLILTTGIQKCTYVYNLVLTTGIQQCMLVHKSLHLNVITASVRYCKNFPRQVTNICFHTTLCLRAAS